MVRLLSLILLVGFSIAIQAQTVVLEERLTQFNHLSLQIGARTASIIGTLILDLEVAKMHL
ncbi:MAG: hypothetical protein KDC92_03800 [Bacteroidetes bacterium]|nr:hypothetical protein [Bacteroidota bacterium]